jgi:predicted DNA-binding protein (MmcQ/YjbR family)
VDITLVLKLITESHAIVYQGLTKKARNAFENR